MSNKGPIKSFAIVAFIAFLLSLPLWWENVYWIHILCFVCINILLTSSLRIISLTGELSLGAAGFMLVGAYGSGLLSINLGLSVWLSMLLGGLMSALVAFILGTAIIRTRGVYFSILTLLTSEIFRLTMWYWKSMSGGPAGLRNIPSPNSVNILGMITIAFEDKIPNYYVILVIVILSLIILYRFERSLGLTWMAVKRSGVLSESIGIGVFNHKLIAFVIGCFFSGIAGALFAHYMGIIETSETGKFGALASIYTIIYMVVGGEASFAGPILGAGILTIMPELFRPLKEYQPIIFGVLVIFIMFFMRQGLISFPYHLRLGWIRVGEFLRKFGLEKV